jgi:hypothetical protein
VVPIRDVKRRKRGRICFSSKSSLHVIVQKVQPQSNAINITLQDLYQHVYTKNTQYELVSSVRADLCA